MCHYVTATLRSAIAPDCALAIAESHNLQFEPVANSFVQQQLRQGEGYFRLGRGMCDCGTPLGSREQASSRRPSSKELAKLRKRGWGEAKINRWLEQQKANQQQRERTRKDREALEGPLLDTWVSFLRALLDTGEVEWLGLLLHWYSRDLESERIQIQSRRPIPLTDVSADLLREIDEDVLYEFQGARRPTRR
jgi:hypothetical protein